MTDKKNPKWVPQLLAWYDVHKRELPWRGCGDPYKIWVSEVMSQQTRIEAMKPYYDNWMRLFPTLEDLAKASEDKVVHAWQGLGEDVDSGRWIETDVKTPQGYTITVACVYVQYIGKHGLYSYED